MTKADEAVASFKSGFSCSQAVLSSYAEELGMDRDTANRVACGFGGGIGRTGNAGRCPDMPRADERCRDHPGAYSERLMGRTRGCERSGGGADLANPSVAVNGTEPARVAESLTGIWCEPAGGERGAS